MENKTEHTPSWGIASEAQRIHSSFDQTGISFHDRADALAAFGRPVTFNDHTGDPEAFYDGQDLPLSECLKRFAYDRQDLVDRRTLPREGMGTTRAAQLSKSSFSTTAEKTAYIREHGVDAWESLPLKPPVSTEVRTKQDFWKLPVEEKSRRIRENPNYVETLPNAPPQVQTGFAKVNYDLLEKQRKLRPGSR